jgi:hypothetical protein
LCLFLSSVVLPVYVPVVLQEITLQKSILNPVKNIKAKCRGNTENMTAGVLSCLVRIISIILTMMADYRDLLKRYIPEQSVDSVEGWLKNYSIRLRLRSSRRSRMGSYHPPHNGHSHYISVNQDLHSYAFLIILVHEIAHAVTWDRYQNRVKPHGNEWKNTFRTFMQPLLDKALFPDDIAFALKNYLNKTYASTVTDPFLTRVLQKYQNEGMTLLEDLPLHALFRVHDGRTFKKLEKVRKRYRCLCLKSKRLYLFNPITQIIPADTE